MAEEDDGMLVNVVISPLNEIRRMSYRERNQDFIRRKFRKGRSGEGEPAENENAKAGERWTDPSNGVTSSLPPPNAEKLLKWDGHKGGHGREKEAMVDILPQYKKKVWPAFSVGESKPRKGFKGVERYDPNKAPSLPQPKPVETAYRDNGLRVEEDGFESSKVQGPIPSSQMKKSKLDRRESGESRKAVNTTDWDIVKHFVKEEGHASCIEQEDGLESSKDQESIPSKQMKRSKLGRREGEESIKTVNTTDWDTTKHNVKEEGHGSRIEQQEPNLHQMTKSKFGIREGGKFGKNVQATNDTTSVANDAVTQKCRRNEKPTAEEGSREQRLNGGGKADVANERVVGKDRLQAATGVETPLGIGTCIREEPPKPKLLPKDIAAQVFSATKFGELGLASSLAQHIEGFLGFSVPTHIQKIAIPLLLSGRDVLVNAETGTGKTLVYLLPIIHMLQEFETRLTRSDGTLALILAPTRELCLQICSVVKQLVHRYHWLIPGYLTGGENKQKEKARLRRGITILVATPGRLLDHLRNTASFRHDQLRWLVFDEADRLLDLGFEKSILEIIRLLKQQRSTPTTATEGVGAAAEVEREGAKVQQQNVLLSATLNQRLERLATVSLREDAITVGFDGKLQTAVIGDIRKVGEGTETIRKEERVVEKTNERRDTENNNNRSSNGGAKPESGLHIVAAEAEVQVRPTERDPPSTLGEDIEMYNIPSGLKQMYIEVPARSRLVSLASFVRSMSLRKQSCKMVLFFSTCSSVEFHYSLFKYFKLFSNGAYREEMDNDGDGEQDGGEKFVPCPIFKLHGNLDQKERAKSFMEFSGINSGVLLCTDVAARGLDFPSVDTIVQYDPPGEASDYVHRVGRTARLGQNGESLLFLIPSEMEYLGLLRSHNVKLSKLPVLDVLNEIPFEDRAKRRHGHERGGKHGGTGREQKVFADTHEGATWLQTKLEGMVASQNKLQQLAVDAFGSFVRAYAAQKGSLRRIFHVKSLHLGHIAKSFGLKAPPHTLGSIVHNKELKRKRDESAIAKKKRRLRPGKMLE